MQISHFEKTSPSKDLVARFFMVYKSLLQNLIWDGNMTHTFHGIFLEELIHKKTDRKMKETLIVLLLEDNKYYNDLLTRALKSILRFRKGEMKYQPVLYSYTDYRKCLRKIKSGDLAYYDTIAFVDYYLGDGMNGGHVIKLLKAQNKNATAILISQSKGVEGKSNVNHHDYFVVKDHTAPAVCLLHLEQFIEDRMI